MYWLDGQTEALTVSIGGPLRALQLEKAWESVQLCGKDKYFPLCALVLLTSLDLSASLLPSQNVKQSLPFDN